MYQDYIIDPKINVYIESYRPVTFFVKGEVKSPGLYTLKAIKARPKLYSALQNANGVTNRADLSNIKILRKNSKTQGGGKIETTVDLLSTITQGDQSQNILIFDGTNWNQHHISSPVFCY